jgi:hypothetical protein
MPTDWSTAPKLRPIQESRMFQPDARTIRRGYWNAAALSVVLAGVTAFWLAEALLGHGASHWVVVAYQVAIDIAMVSRSVVGPVRAYRALRREQRPLAGH